MKLFKKKKKVACFHCGGNPFETQEDMKKLFDCIEDECFTLSKEEMKR